MYNEAPHPRLPKGNDIQFIKAIYDTISRIDEEPPDAHYPQPPCGADSQRGYEEYDPNFHYSQCYGSCPRKIGRSSYEYGQGESCLWQSRWMLLTG